MARKRSAPVAVLTMVRDDEDFLRLWLDHYGGLFGRQALYIVNDGMGEMVRDLAAGCSLIGLPGDPDPRFDARRWRMLNLLVQALRIHHRWVIVGDVDELVAADPAVGSLPQVIRKLPQVPVVTPFGLELVHRPAEEPEPFARPLLARRRHVRVAPLYAKPCIVGGDVRLSRGGHYADAPELTMPEGLYLLHLKHADRSLYAATMDRRNATVAATGAGKPSDIMIGRHWFASHRNDAATFAAIDGAPVAREFDPGAHRAAMAASWRPRGETGYWEFEPPADPHLYRLPERFAGLL